MLLGVSFLSLYASALLRTLVPIKSHYLDLKPELIDTTDCAQTAFLRIAAL